MENPKNAVSKSADMKGKNINQAKQPISNINTEPNTTNQPSPIPAENKQKKSKWWIWVLGCCGGLVILAIILLVIGYFTIGKKIIKEAKKLSENEGNFNFEEVQQEILNDLENTYEQETSDSEYSMNSTALSPEEVVENYLNSVLGTLPQSDLDDTKAKSYLSDKLNEQYDDPYFTQQTLCIQDGPTDIKISNQDTYGEEAYITVAAEYGGEFEDIWDFALEMENDEWVIYAIYCLKN